MVEQKNKEDAFDEFMEMIFESWTWARLNALERERFISWMNWMRNDTQVKHFRGNHSQRWTQMNDLYHMFLEGCGYKPSGWRGE